MGTFLFRCLHVEHHYFGARHGKGLSDGETAVVKRQASSAIVSGTAVINDAEDLYKFCAQNMSTTDQVNKCQHFQIQIFYSDNINRERGQEDVDLHTIKGTRLLHCAKGNIQGRLWTRNLSCFCDGCTGMNHCQNPEYVDLWKSEVLFTRQPSVTKLSFHSK